MEKKEKGNCRVTFLHYHELTSRNQPVDFQVCSPNALKWPVPSPQKSAPSQGGMGHAKSPGSFVRHFVFVFYIAKGISWLYVTLMGRPITRNFWSQKRFIVQEGYLRINAQPCCWFCRFKLSRWYYLRVKSLLYRKFKLWRSFAIKSLC